MASFVALQRHDIIAQAVSSTTAHVPQKQPLAAPNHPCSKEKQVETRQDAAPVASPAPVGRA
jgi:hypothetical protein